MKGSMCKVCGHEHWMRDPHILPKNAPAETRSKRTVNQEHHDKVLKDSKQALGLETPVGDRGTPENPRAAARKPARKKAKKGKKK